jgi:hypothetical protein
MLRRFDDFGAGSVGACVRGGARGSGRISSGLAKLVPGEIVEDRGAGARALPECRRDVSGRSAGIGPALTESTQVREGGGRGGHGVGGPDVDRNRRGLLGYHAWKQRKSDAYPERSSQEKHHGAVLPASLLPRSIHIPRSDLAGAVERQVREFSRIGRNLDENLQLI